MLNIYVDYADSAYAALATSAQELWRSEWGAENRYHETGLCFTAEAEQEAYVTKSLENVRTLLTNEAKKKGVDVEKHIHEAIEVLESHEDILRTVKTGGANGTLGYLNRRSGWADAEATMRYLRQQVESLNRIHFIRGTVKRLTFSPDHALVQGAQLDDGQCLHADLTILAAGAWTPTLLDLRGILQATGQILAYLELSDSEAEQLSKTPTQLNMSTGMTKHSGLFAIPPPHPSQQISLPSNKRRLYWKIARHCHGYSNYITIPHPENPAAPSITVSAPHHNPATPTVTQQIPQEGVKACREYLESILSSDSPLRTRPFAFTRICHYADTTTGDWLIDYHPRYNKTLFLATGGSGHAFKFLPVIGDKVVECLVGKCPEEFREKWKWREAVAYEEWSGDGSRGGKKGMILEDELREA
jgi:sarcosine oxidase/L-pipecolate oxidase